jgi:enediyne biosynthesis thioesterase
VYRHVVSFDETNVVGNVYFAHHLAWQGRCRELFLRDHTPGLLARIGPDLVLATLKASCEYHDELYAFDSVEIRMRLAYQRNHRIGLAFDYVVERGGRESLVASGFQEVACLRRAGGGLHSQPIPHDLHEALESYRDSPLDRRVL